MGTVQLIHGDELIEDTIVKHQAHALIGGIVLKAEETFRGIVRLHIVHAWLGYQLPVLLAIGSKGHSAVEEDFQIGPHLFQTVYSCLLQNLQQDGKHP